MDESLSTAIREAYAVCPNSVLQLHTLEISSAAMDGKLYLVQAYKNVEALLEDGVTTATFKATPFRFTRPPTGENGLQELGVAIDNVDRRLSDFFLGVKFSKAPVVVKYRVYLEDNLAVGPENDPPLVLYLTDVVMDTYQVTARATFVDLVNRKFPAQPYTRTRFPSLGDG